jgi:hypothetical protein
MIPKPPKVAAPEKELRFTRSGQALGFWFAAMALVAAAIAIAVAGSGRLTEPDRLHPMWAAVPLVAAWLLARLAMRMTRHAYLILTPIGIEVFPFFRPAEQMRVITWSEIADAEADERLRVLTLHFNAEHTAGVRLTLRPLRDALRPLLVEAVLGRVRGVTIANPS